MTFPAVKVSADHTDAVCVCRNSEYRALLSQNQVEKNSLAAGLPDLCRLSGSITYLDVERNADEDVPTYGDDDSQEKHL